MAIQLPKSKGSLEPLVKRIKFQKLAEKRMEKTLKDIALIGNLSNRSVYEYTEQEVKEMFRTLSKEINKAKAKFEKKPKTKKPGTFQFSIAVDE